MGKIPEKVLEFHNSVLWDQYYAKNSGIWDIILNSWWLGAQIKGGTWGEKYRANFVMETLATMLVSLWRCDPSLDMGLIQQSCIFASGNLKICLYYLASAHPYCIVHSALFFTACMILCLFAPLVTELQPDTHEAEAEEGADFWCAESTAEWNERTGLWGLQEQLEGVSWLEGCLLIPFSWSYR